MGIDRSQCVQWIDANDALPPKSNDHVLLHIRLVANLKGTKNKEFNTLVVEVYLPVLGSLVYSDRAKNFTLTSCHSPFISFHDWMWSPSVDYNMVIDVENIENCNLNELPESFRTVNILSQILRWSYI